MMSSRVLGSLRYETFGFGSGLQITSNAWFGPIHNSWANDVQSDMGQSRLRLKQVKAGFFGVKASASQIFASILRLHHFQRLRLRGLPKLRLCIQPLENVYPCQDGTAKPLPSLAHNLRNPTLTATKFWPKYIHLLAQIHKKGTLCGTTVVEKWFIGTIAGAQRRKFGQLCAIFDILHSPWHNHWKNHTLSGTHQVFKTLPYLAYVYCHQWECGYRPMSRLFSVC